MVSQAFHPLVPVHPWHFLFHSQCLSGWCWSSFSPRNAPLHLQLVARMSSFLQTLLTSWLGKRGLACTMCFPKPIHLSWALSSLHVCLPLWTLPYGGGNHAFRIRCCLGVYLSNTERCPVAFTPGDLGWHPETPNRDRAESQIRHRAHGSHCREVDPQERPEETRKG